MAARHTAQGWCCCRVSRFLNPLCVDGVAASHAVKPLVTPPSAPAFRQLRQGENIRIPPPNWLEVTASLCWVAFAGDDVAVLTCVCILSCGCAAAAARWHHCGCERIPRAARPATPGRVQPNAGATRVRGRRRLHRHDRRRQVAVSTAVFQFRGVLRLCLLWRRCGSCVRSVCGVVAHRARRCRTHSCP